MKQTKKKNGYTYTILETDKGLYFASVSDPGGQVVAYECGRITVNHFDGIRTETTTPNSAFGKSRTDMFVPARLKNQCRDHFKEQCMRTPA